jgi:hypothetical protein
MPTVRTFAYNSGTGVTGTTQVGYIAAGATADNYGAGLTWWKGPDEDLGYVICGTSGARTAGQNSYAVASPTIGFLRSTAKTDPSFLSLCNVIAKQTFATTLAATDWLTSNGYWTSYTGSSGVTFSQLFTVNTSPGTAIENAWTTFRSQLTGSYTNFTFTSSLSGSTAYNVTDATKVQTLATALKNGSITSVNIGGMQWLVGCCACRAGGTTPNAVEFSNVASCSGSSTASLRPWIGNANWGGIGTTVGAQTQTLTLTFS